MENLPLPREKHSIFAHAEVKTPSDSWSIDLSELICKSSRTATFQTSPSLSFSFFPLPPRSDAERALSLARSMIALHFPAAQTPAHSWSLCQAFRAARLSENTVTQCRRWRLSTCPTFSFSFSSFFWLSPSIIHVPPAKATAGGGGGGGSSRSAICVNGHWPECKF